MSVIVCSASSPPALSNISDNVAKSIPQNTIWILGDLLEFFEEILSITNIPESADVTKNMMIIEITIKLKILERGRYSKNLNIRASGSDTREVSVPCATLKSIQIALLPKTDIQIKLNNVGMIKTAAINSRMLRPFEIFAIKSPTTVTRKSTTPSKEWSNYKTKVKFLPHKRVY